VFSLYYEASPDGLVGVVIVGDVDSCEGYLLPQFSAVGALIHSAPAMDCSVSPDRLYISLREMVSDGLKVIGINSAISFL
jgi:hypothetical protein